MLCKGWRAEYKHWIYEMSNRGGSNEKKKPERMEYTLNGSLKGLISQNT